MPVEQSRSETIGWRVIWILWNLHISIFFHRHTHYVRFCTLELPHKRVKIRDLTASYSTKRSRWWTKGKRTEERRRKIKRERESRVSNGRALSCASEPRATKNQCTVGRVRVAASAIMRSDRFGSPIYRLVLSIYLLRFFRPNEWLLYLWQ